VERAGAGRYWAIWAAVLPILIWALVRILGVHGGFPLVPLLAYTPYVAAAALIAAGVAVALRNWAASALAGLAAVLLFAALAPRAVGGGDELPSGAAELRVLSTNIHHGTAEPAALVGLVDRFDADVLSVQELTPSFARELAAAGIAKRLPNAILSMHRGASGGGIYSRLPMQKLEGPPPSDFRNPRALLSADGHRFRLVAVHPYPPTLNHVSLWREGLEKLPAADPSGPPWLLAGDFNATLDFPELNDLIDTGYRDAGAVTGRGLEPTWPSGEIFPPPVTIDHVLADRRAAILDYAVEDLPGSDHRAVFARLGLP
jgi:endonuclease/exonuclease/phosphatase (EEP) superfamily protein YafD